MLDQRLGDDRTPQWWAEFLKPFNIVTTLLAILGIGLAYYFYIAGEVYPEISWIVATQIVFDGHNPTPGLTISDTSGQKIDSNVYAAQFTVWNSGNERLDDVDATTLIRQPLTFTLAGNGRILNISITDQAKDSAGAWAIGITAGQKSASMTWKHFDPGAGAKILILFAGDDLTAIRPSIVLVGGSILERPGNYMKPMYHLLWYILGVTIPLLAISLWGMYSSLKDFRTRLMTPARQRAASAFQGARSLMIFVVVAAIICFILSLFIFYLMRPTPPF